MLLPTAGCRVLVLTRIALLHHLPCLPAQVVVDHDDAEEAFAQLQEPLARARPWAMPPLLAPLVVTAPFGSGKREMLQRLVKALQGVLAVPRMLTTKPRAPGDAQGVRSAGRRASPARSSKNLHARTGCSLLLWQRCLRRLV